MGVRRVYIDTFNAHARKVKMKYPGLRYNPRYSDEGVSSSIGNQSCPWRRMREGCIVQHAIKLDAPTPAALSIIRNGRCNSGWSKHRM